MTKYVDTSGNLTVPIGSSGSLTYNNSAHTATLTVGNTTATLNYSDLSVSGSTTLTAGPVSVKLSTDGTGTVNMSYGLLSGSLTMTSSGITGASLNFGESMAGATAGLGVKLTDTNGVWSGTATAGLTVPDKVTIPILGKEVNIPGANWTNNNLSKTVTFDPVVQDPCDLMGNTTLGSTCRVLESSSQTGTINTNERDQLQNDSYNDGIGGETFTTVLTSADGTATLAIGSAGTIATTDAAGAQLFSSNTAQTGLTYAEYNPAGTFLDATIAGTGTYAYLSGGTVNLADSAAATIMGNHDTVYEGSNGTTTVSGTSNLAFIQGTGDKTTLLGTTDQSVTQGTGDTTWDESSSGHDWVTGTNDDLYLAGASDSGEVQNGGNRLWGTGNGDLMMDEVGANSTMEYGTNDKAWVDQAGGTNWVHGSGNELDVNGASTTTYVQTSGNTVFTSGTNDGTVVSATNDATVMTGAGDKTWESAASDQTWMQGTGEETDAESTGDRTYVESTSDNTFNTGANDVTIDSGASDGVISSGAGDVEYVYGTNDRTWAEGSNDITWAQGSSDLTYASGYQDVTHDSNSSDITSDTGTGDTYYWDGGSPSNDPGEPSDPYDPGGYGYILRAPTGRSAAGISVGSIDDTVALPTAASSAPHPIAAPVLASGSSGSSIAQAPGVTLASGRPTATTAPAATAPATLAPPPAAAAPIALASPTLASSLSPRRSIGDDVLARLYSFRSNTGVATAGLAASRERTAALTSASQLTQALGTFGYVSPMHAAVADHTLERRPATAHAVML